MFDIGWSELLVIAVVALIAIGPKELPGVLRMVGQWMGKARKMAAEFQGQFNEAMREAEMADLKKSFDDIKDTAAGFTSNNILTSLSKDVDAAMTVDKIESIDTPPALPTTPEPPTPDTFAEAEAHQPAMEPLAIVSEAQRASSEPTADLPVVAEPHALAQPDLIQDLANDPAKGAKAS
jgi:sec-independent protein translocase protein TatB